MELFFTTWLGTGLLLGIFAALFIRTLPPIVRAIPFLITAIILFGGVINPTQGLPDYDSLDVTNGVIQQARIRRSEYSIQLNGIDTRFHFPRSIGDKEALRALETGHYVTIANRPTPLGRAKVYEIRRSGEVLLSYEETEARIKTQNRFGIILAFVTLVLGLRLVEAQLRPNAKKQAR